MFNDPFMKRNADTRKEFFKGYLQVKGKSGTVSVPFNYSIITTRHFSIQNSVMPGTEFIQPNEVIRTTNLDLDIAKDMDITLADGRTMTVLTADKEIDHNRAYMTGSGDIAWRITLQGGK